MDKISIDAVVSREMIGSRFATAQPVFGSLRGNKRRDRSTLRGWPEVDAQWKLYYMVHDIEKLARHGYAH